MNSQTDGQVNRWMDNLLDQLIDGWMGEYIIGYIDGRIFNKPENKINQMIGLQSFHMFVFSYSFVS